MIFRAAVLTLAMGIAGSALPAAADEARAILDRAKKLDETTRHWTDRTRTLTLHIHGKRGGERRRDLKVFEKRYEDDEDKSISVFLGPAEVRGTTFLQWVHAHRDDDQWLYLPEFKRTRRITSKLRNQSFVGTDFTYRDLEIVGELQDWTEEEAPSKLLGEETVDSVVCHKIELRPRQDDMPYDRIILWMSRDRLVVRKIEFYEKGVAAKSLTATDIRDVGPIPTAYRLEMSDLKTGSRTVVTLTEILHDTGLSDDLFTQRQLERLGANPTG